MISTYLRHIKEGSQRTATTAKFMSLEAFRGLAAIMVVLYHSRFFASDSYVPFVKHSDVFVDFFFIISGFVLSYSYLHKIGTGMTFRKFFVLRLGRLYPLHLFTLLLWVPYILVKVVLYGNGVGDTDPAESNNMLTFVSNVFMLHGFDGYLPLSWNYPSWSISTEFCAYMAFYGIIVLLLFHVFATGSQIFFLSIIISVSAYGATWVLDDGSGTELFLLQCVGGFFLGVFIFLLYDRKRFSPSNIRVATMLEILGILLVVLCVSSISRQGFRENIHYYLSILSFALVIWLFVFQDAGYVSRLLKTSALQYIGKLSYSIYLLHAIILAVAENFFVYILKFDKTSFTGVSNVIVFEEAAYVNMVIILIVIICSAFTYEYIEAPWREKFKKLASKF